MKLVLPATVPIWQWIFGAVLGLLLMTVGFWALRKAARNRTEARRLRDQLRELQRSRPGSADEQAKAAEARSNARTADRLVKFAATVCILLYIGLFASSFQAIAGFAEDFLGRHGVMVPATPLTLDGVVIGALLLSLAFVAKRKSPAKAHMLIWGMTIFSAFCGFQYGEGGADGSMAAGLYYAVMSIVGMFMFHMVLELFMPDGDFVKSKYPSMGWRWFTHWSTIPVMLCWINHPPRRREEGQRPSVREAIDHWQHVKTIRVRARAAAAAAVHARNLEDARRQGELTAIRREMEEAAARASAPAQKPAAGFTAARSIHAASRPTVGALDTAARPASVTASVPEAPEAETAQQVKVPSTAEACATWMDQWVRLAAAYPQFADGSRGIKNEDAQSSAGCSDRQARFVRDAARSGQLRARAAEVGVPVPDAYQDRPENDRRMTAVAS
ncbi:Protein of unknown function [Asanoa hainanensis]|uniref:DUF2637 domain-containing protein n=1 Tax=Asanoa hainanensis TaxID=560556 RepID=A0A239PFU2_9ACTN|nr:DUF2637 domain-containing protein [Asanoa hainanensis]SNT65901.1 Protein of unknown function [Asanoa hainanensis]